MTPWFTYIFGLVMKDVNAYPWAYNLDRLRSYVMGCCP